MKIHTFPAGPIATNAFLVVDEASKEALVIDAPPEATADLAAAARGEGLTVRLIVLTHAHWDHIVDTADLKETTGAPVAAHAGSLPRLENPGTTIMDIPYRIAPIAPDQLLDDGDTVPLGRYAFTVLHTPGHAPGQISLYEADERVMFGGDTLFAGGYGRVDLPGSSVEDTVATIQRLLDLPDDVTVYPGHGEPTTIGAERPWMEQIARQRPG